MQRNTLKGGTGVPCAGGGTHDWQKVWEKLMTKVAKPATLGALQGPAAVTEEIRQRIINIELQIKILLREQVPLMPPGLASFAENLGDQLYGSRTYAQHGDDLAILNIFDMIGITRPSYLDIGAHDPFKISNTALLYLRGSRGINVEANPRLIEAFRVQRPDDVKSQRRRGRHAGDDDVPCV